MKFSERKARNAKGGLPPSSGSGTRCPALPDGQGGRLPEAPPREADAPAEPGAGGPVPALPAPDSPVPAEKEAQSPAPEAQEPPEYDAPEPFGGPPVLPGPQYIPPEAENAADAAADAAKNPAGAPDADFFHTGLSGRRGNIDAASPGDVETETAPQGRSAPGRRAAAGKAVQVLRCLAAVLLSAALLLDGLYLFTVGALRASSRPKEMENLLRTLRPAAIPAALLAPDAEADELLADWFCRKLGGGTGPVTPRQLETFLDRSTLLPALAEKLSAFAGDIFSGTAETTLQRDEMAALLLANRGLFQDITGFPLTEALCRQMAKQLDDAGILELANAETLKYELPTLYYGLHIGLSWYCVGACFLLGCLLVFLLERVTRSFLRALRDLGIVLTLLGLALVLAAMTAKLFPGLWQSWCGGNYVGALLSGELLFRHLRYSGGMLLTGLLLQVAVSLVRSLRARRALRLQAKRVRALREGEP